MQILQNDTFTQKVTKDPTNTKKKKSCLRSVLRYWNWDFEQFLFPVTRKNKIDSMKTGMAHNFFPMPWVCTNVLRWKPHCVAQYN
jgi:hypothetical protein